MATKSSRRDPVAAPESIAACCTISDIANWRKAGLLNGIGAKPGRVHCYNHDDVLSHIAPLCFLSRCGLGLVRAHAVVVEHAADIKAAVLSEGPSADQSRDLCVMPSLRVPLPSAQAGGHGAQSGDVPEALLHVNFSAIARFTATRLRACQQAQRERQRGRRGPITPTISTGFIAR